MGTRTKGSSTFARMGASAANRLTEGLLSSGGKVAGAGLILALLTLGFTIWFRFELGYQSEVGTPMARSAAGLDAAISQSIAALRAWVAYGDPLAVEERSQIWENRIEPTLLRVTELAAASRDPAAAERAIELRNSLRGLARIQWAIEDVARTPGNEPAAVAYARRLEPVRRSILLALDGAIELYSADRPREHSVVFLARLARFRSAFSQADLVMNELIIDYSEVREHEVKEQLRSAREIASQIDAEAPRHCSGDNLRMIEFAVGEFEAYELQVPEIIALRRSAAWNVAQGLFVQEAQPLVARARSVSGALAKEQARLSEAQARDLTRASYVVIAAALVMGFLSTGSLFVSLRLRRQVENVMAKAKKLGAVRDRQATGEGRNGRGLSRSPHYVA